MSALLKAKLRRGETVFGQMVMELFTPGIAHDRFRASDAGYFARANDETIVIALIETARAFDNLDEILATPGLDVAWMGHFDLTASMGKFDHPRFLEAIDRLVDGCRHFKVAAGFLPASPGDAVRWMERVTECGR